MNVLIYGSKVFGRVVRELVRDCGHADLGFIDDVDENGPEVVGSWTAVEQRYSPADNVIAMAIGYRDLLARWEAYSRVVRAGFRVATLIHPRAYVARSAAIGSGAMIMAGANIDSSSRIGEVCVIWPGCVVSHDCVIGANTFLSPNSTVCGITSIGRDCFIGAGAVVVDQRTVPDCTFIRAGSLYK